MSLQGWTQRHLLGNGMRLSLTQASPRRYGTIKSDPERKMRGLSDCRGHPVGDKVRSSWPVSGWRQKSKGQENWVTEWRRKLVDGLHKLRWGGPKQSWLPCLKGNTLVFNWSIVLASVLSLFLWSSVSGSQVWPARSFLPSFCWWQHPTLS